MLAIGLLSLMLMAIVISSKASGEKRAFEDGKQSALKEIFVAMGSYAIEGSYLIIAPPNDRMTYHLASDCMGCHGKDIRYN